MITRLGTMRTGRQATERNPTEVVACSSMTKVPGELKTVQKRLQTGTVSVKNLFDMMSQNTPFYFLFLTQYLSISFNTFEKGQGVQGVDGGDDD